MQGPGPIVGFLVIFIFFVFCGFFPVQKEIKTPWCYLDDDDRFIFGQVVGNDGMIQLYKSQSSSLGEPELRGVQLELRNFFGFIPKKTRKQVMS